MRQQFKEHSHLNQHNTSHEKITSDLHFPLKPTTCDNFVCLCVSLIVIFCCNIEKKRLSSSCNYEIDPCFQNLVYSNVPSILCIYNRNVTYLKYAKNCLMIHLRYYDYEIGKI